MLLYKDLTSRSAGSSVQEPGEQSEASVVDLDILATDRQVIKSTGRSRSSSSVNSEIVAMYWQIGERIICEEQTDFLRAAYGERVRERNGRVLSTYFDT